MRKLDYIWSINERKLSPTKRWWLRTMKRGLITVECITKNNIMSFASALTFSSMLAAVPVMAIVIATARGFGFASIIEDGFKEMLQDNPDVAETMLMLADSYLTHTQSGVFIGSGLIVLIYSLITLTNNVETAFNTIWFVPSGRSIYRKMTNYISAFLLLPFLIIIASGLNIFALTFQSLFPDYQIVSNTVERIVQIGPTVLTCISFSLLYKLMPNTQVSLKHTLGPGVLAGLAFMALQYFYIHYQIKLSSYNAIYGSLAILPLLMIMLQASWSICLIGGQMCYANQFLNTYVFERSTEEASRRYTDTICLLLMCRISKRFAAGGVPFTERTLAADTQLPGNTVRNTLYKLVAMGLLIESRSNNGKATHYVPAIDVHRLTIKNVIAQIDNYGTEERLRAWHPRSQEWEQLREMRNNDKDALLIDIQ